MRADFSVLLDACVLANAGVCDLYLRLAEEPRLYMPRWSESILDEVKRTQMTKLTRPYSEELARYWRSEVTSSFPEALVSNFEMLVPLMTNDPKDRHVLAAAVRGKTTLIVTFNLKHFTKLSLDPWEIKAVHPQDYLLTLYSISPSGVWGRVAAIARDRDAEIEDVLIRLGKSVPLFAQKLLEDN